MASITLKGNPISTIGELPEIGSQAKEFNLVKNNLSSTSLSDYKGKRLILNVFPSLDTGTCAASVRNFNQRASELDNTEVLCISRDLPFAQARFCGAEGIDKVTTVSDFISGKFGQDYQLEIATGPLAHLHSRSIIVLDENHKVVYTQQVGEIIDEPDYEAAMTAAK